MVVVVWLEKETLFQLTSIVQVKFCDPGLRSLCLMRMSSGTGWVRSDDEVLLLVEVLLCLGMPVTAGWRSPKVLPFEEALVCLGLLWTPIRTGWVRLPLPLEEMLACLGSSVRVGWVRSDDEDMSITLLFEEMLAFLGMFWILVIVRSLLVLLGVPTSVTIG